MLRTLIDSRWAFRCLLAIPALGMFFQYFIIHASLGHVLEASGEWAVRMLVVTLAVTPLRLLMKQSGMGPHWPMWLFKRRRDLGLAAFLYAALHLSVYVVRQSNINVILYEMQFVEYIMGWLALAAMLVLTLISNDRAVHALGLWWKTAQRLAYVAAVTAALHWFWIKLDHTPVYVHFLPLVLLEAYRLWYNFARPAGTKH
ncbi:sulfite oxidase heme-binding subunit YedZ [Aestuariivirga sp.]|uniref:sulfite oxidase heme-binding subunit YedZ n=1 Tax=Aestuariivirga sp. TaxID=2650926 RepID=UPI003593FB1F